MRLRRVVVAASVLLPLAAASVAQAEQVWEPKDTDGPQIIKGTGPPGAYVALVSVNSGRPSTSTEETSPTTGAFRLDNGSCNPGAQCFANGDTFQVVFWAKSAGGTTIWAPNTYARADAQKFDLPDVNRAPGPRDEQTVSGPSSLPPYSTITGSVFGATAGGSQPLHKVHVVTYDGQGRGYSAYNCQNCASIGDTYSLTDGSYSVKVPPGNWKLGYETEQVDDNYPVRWPNAFSGCAASAASATAVAANSAAPAITLGPSCATTTPGPPTGGGGPGGDGGSTAGGAGGGSSAGNGAGSPASGPAPGAPTSGAAAKLTLSGSPKAVGAELALALNVSSAGSVTATATTAKARIASAGAAARSKDVVVARASARTSKAGKVSLRLKPSNAARKTVKRRGKLAVTVTVTFKPTAGSAKTIKKKATFKRAAKKR